MDVKPANILLGRDGAIKITDFGIAELLEQGAEKKRDTVFGTPGYLPPEALRGGVYDERGDLFAAGVVIYEALTGRPPFRGRTARELIVQTLAMRVKSPGLARSGVPAGLDAFVLRLMAADPEQRPANATAAIEELGVWVTGHSVSQHGIPAWRPDLEDDYEENTEQSDGKTAPERADRVHAGLHDTLSPDNGTLDGKTVDLTGMGE